MSDKNNKKVLENIDRYYSGKIKEYGGSPKGVDWKDEEGQFLRFQQLLQLIKTDEHFSLVDLGCGYGKLFHYMVGQYNDFKYYGLDLSLEMIKEARKIQKDLEKSEFKHIQELDELIEADFIVASGIFNVKMYHNEAEWLAYILETMEKMNGRCRKGFAFNVLTKYSDKEYMRDDLYYADPCFLFDYCKRNFSLNVSLLHDYDLYEFTVLVRK